MTRRVQVGTVAIGGGAPVSVQSMTNTDTRDVEATLAQIRALAQAGADIVRVSVYDMDCAKAVRALVDGSPVPLVADIHFDHRLAISAAENGISKLRINPGNIGGEQNVRALADCVKAHHIPVRIGVNSGSVEREILQKYGGPTPEGMLESALGHARMLERCDYPLHVGVTEAGLPGEGTLKSAIGIGALLLAGIGDTIRVSLTGDPVPEVRAGLDILRAVGLRRDHISYISCPTCGRTCIDVGGIMARVQKELADVRAPLKVAVMGCVVNGPGEAREADVGVAGGRDGGALFVKGKAPRKIQGDLAQALIDEVRAMLRAEGEGLS